MVPFRQLFLLRAANKEVKQVLDKPEGKDTQTSKHGMYERCHVSTGKAAFVHQQLPKRPGRRGSHE